MPDRNPDPQGPVRRRTRLTGGALTIGAIVAWLTANPIPSGPHTHTADDLGHPHTSAPAHTHLAADLPTDPDEIADSFTSTDGSIVNSGTADGLDLDIAQATETLLAGCELSDITEAKSETDDVTCMTPFKTNERIDQDTNGTDAGGAHGPITNEHTRGVMWSVNSTVANNRSVAIGATNSTVSGRNSIISGENNNSVSSHTFMTGFGNSSTVPAGRNIIGGQDNEVNGSYSIAHGRDLELSGNYHAIFGQSNIVGSSTANFVSGVENELIAGGQNILGGRRNELEGAGTVTSGESNVNRGSNNFVGGVNNSVALGSNQSLVMGSNLVVNAQHGLIVGLDSEITTPHSSSIGRDIQVDAIYSHAKGYILSTNGKIYSNVYGRAVMPADDFSAVWGYDGGFTAPATSSRSMDLDLITGDLEISGTLTQSVVFAGFGEDFLFKGEQLSMGRLMTTDDGETARYAQPDEPWVCVSRKKLAINMGGGSFTNTPYLQDEFGDRLMEEVTENIEVSGPSKDEDGNEIKATFKEVKYFAPVKNPEYNPDAKEPKVSCEFSGRLWLEIDQSVQAGDWIKSGKDGIATKSEVANGWKVLQIKGNKGLLMAGIFNGFQK